MSNFTLSCCSTTDVPYSRMEKRGIPVLFYTYLIDGEEFIDDMGRDPKALPEFYNKVINGALPTTSQINVDTYYNFFKGLLEQGDVLHLAFTSGLSGSVNNAMTAADMLREEFPERRIKVIDTTCASSGYGMIVDMAADLRDSGSTMDEIAGWVENNKYNMHHQFFTTSLAHFKRSGRVSGATAAIGTILNICPLLQLDRAGSINSYSKARGQSKAIEETVKWMAEHAVDGEDYSGRCYISNSASPDSAKATRDAIEKKFRNLRGRVEIFDIGTVIGSHTGQGTVAVFFMGDERRDR